MVLLTLLVVASILLLIATITKSWRHEKWKSSVLPLLFHPLADEVRPGVEPLKMSELKAVAENRQVRLHRGHLGSQFVQVSIISFRPLYLQEYSLQWVCYTGKYWNMDVHDVDDEILRVSQ